MIHRSAFLPENIEDYIAHVSVREHPVMRELRELTAKHPESGMQTGADQVQFLQLLAKAIGAKRCIEVGVFTGYSALGVALALPDDGEIIACDVSEEFTSIGRPFWEKAGVAHKIDLRLAPATQTLDALIANGQTGTYDFAYIDADKPGYDAYYERVVTLLRPGGIVGIDNVLWSGRVADRSATDPSTSAVRALNEKIGCDERVDAVLLSIGDGLNVVRKR